MLKKEDHKLWSQTDANSSPGFSLSIPGPHPSSAIGGGNKNKNNRLMESLQGLKNVCKALCELWW